VVTAVPLYSGPALPRPCATEAVRAVGVKGLRHDCAAVEGAEFALGTRLSHR
jgi:hypothetical protein